MPVNPDTKLHRLGAIGHMMSLSPVPVSMVGPVNIDQGSIHLEGYLEMVCSHQQLSSPASLAILTRAGPVLRCMAATRKRSGHCEAEGVVHIGSAAREL